MPAEFGFGATSAPPGSAIYGSRVGAIPTPPTPTGPSLAAMYPNLSGTNAAASSALMSELQGQLSPETLANIRNSAATYGVTSGMPGGEMSRFRGLRDVGLTTEQLQHQGINDYSSLIPSVSATQTVNPAQGANLQAGANALNTEINATNATNAAAPDPASAQTYAQQLFNQYLNRNSGPAGGTGRPWWAPTGNTTFVTPGAAGGGRGDPVTGHYV